MSFLDTINTIDDIPEGGDLPLGSITWMHGNKAGKTPGAFFGKATEFSTAPVAPWKPDDRFDDDPGYSAASLKIAFIAWRQQWYMQSDANAAGQPRKEWLPAYTEGAKKQVEYIVFAEGVAEPMILTLPKFTKTKPIQDIVKDYREGLLKQASRIARRGLPLWSFWVPILGKQKDGKVVYEEVQRAGAGTGAYVTYPTAAWPADAMDTLFVGEALLRQGADIARQYAHWTEQKRLPQNVIEAEYIEEVKQLAAPSGRNAPIAVADDELF